MEGGVEPPAGGSEGGGCERVERGALCLHNIGYFCCGEVTCTPLKERHEMEVDCVKRGRLRR
jgi:hypothetical protein